MEKNAEISNYMGVLILRRNGGHIFGGVLSILLSMRRTDGWREWHMMDLREIFAHYTDDMDEGADIRKEAIASIEQAAEHIDEHTLRHQSRLIAIAYLALEAETTQIIDGVCSACGALMDCVDAADYKFCPHCGRRASR